MFYSARIKLTGWYLLIIMVISAFFSALIYRVTTFEMDRIYQAQKIRLERRLSGGWMIYQGQLGQFPEMNDLIDPQVIFEAKRRVVIALSMVNSAILVGAGVLAYFLAGKTLTPIKEMVDEQGRFVSDASHELRTPLTAMRSSIEVGLRDPKLSISEARELLESNAEEVEKLQELSDGMLKLAAFQNGRNKTAREQTNVAEVIKLAIERVTKIAVTKKIKINFSEKDAIIKGVKANLVEMLVTILDNAIKYSHEGGQIDVDVTRSRSTVRIKIKDCGIGISEKDLPHIFERFYRADNARSKDGSGGYGLGLSIAKKIANDHGGNITVNSKLNSGSVFSIVLPSIQSLRGPRA